MTVENERSDAIQSEAEQTAKAAEPINLTFKGRQWTLDFNRRSIQAITKDRSLAEALDISDESAALSRLARWTYTIPQIIAFATQKNHVPAMQLSMAEEIFEELGADRVSFAARLAGLYTARVAELMGIGHEDVTEQGSTGNVNWE